MVFSFFNLVNKNIQDLKAKALSNVSLSYFLPCSGADSLTGCSADSLPACGKTKKTVKPVQSPQPWEIVPRLQISSPFNLI